jgi:hypothetical protein
MAGQHVGRKNTMLRAIVGTAAVLAGFAVLERSVDASTGYAGSCTATQAYALLQRGEMVSVRAAPTPQAAVIGMLSDRAASHAAKGGEPARNEVAITGSQSGWARIALNTARGYTAAAGATQSFGWIPADLLSVDTRVDGTITVYDRPGLLGQALTTIQGDDMTFRVLGCRGGWLQVVNARHGNVWIDKWCAREEGCRG